MDPEGEEPTDARGIVSDAEGDLPAGGQAGRENRTSGNDANRPPLEGEQLELQEQHSQHSVPPAIQPLQQQQQLQPVMQSFFPPPWPHGMHPHGLPPQDIPPPPAPSGHHALAMAQYYEARMRDHAAAYASAAAGAAWAAAQIAAQAAEFAANANNNSSAVGSAPDQPQFPVQFDPNNATNIPPSLPLPPPPPPGGPPMYYPDGCLYQAPPMVPPGVDPNLYYYQNTYAVPPTQQAGYEGHQEGNDDENQYQRSNRKKRFQRRPPNGISIPNQTATGNPRYNNSITTANSNNNNNSSNNNINNHNGNNQSRVRRRHRDNGGDSSNSSCCSGSFGTSATSYNSDQALGNYSSKFLSGGKGRHYHRYKKKQRQPRDDSSLLGKTGISALYEWCDKRRMKQPSFVLLSPREDEGESETKEGTVFEMAVNLSDGEWGRGCGRSKGSAKQDAARKALLALVPGVVFDSESGILIELPADSGVDARRDRNAEASASLEDLAPHLAKRLAIATGQDDENEEASNSAELQSGDKSSKKLKRTWKIYPGTTTSTGTSEDDEGNAYDTSREAPVCSVLLHAMVQIDGRIPEAPQYSFETSDPAATNTQMKRKGPASSYGNAIVIHRNTSFTCTAKLKVTQNLDASPEAINPDLCGPSIDTNVASPQPTTSDSQSLEENCEENRKLVGQSKDDRADLKSEEPFTIDSKQPEDKTKKESDPLVGVLEAVGVGRTKREARHNASAKLLALLFPDCKTMMEVKAAAEAAREQYAASRAMKQHTKRGFTDSVIRRRPRRVDETQSPRFSLSSVGTDLRAFYLPGDPPVPDHIRDELLSILGRKRPARKMSSVSSQVAGFEKLNLNQDAPDETENPGTRGVAILDSKTDVEGDHFPAQGDMAKKVQQDFIVRQLSRQKQLEEQVERALQSLYEHDEEGRSLPDELTVDDVGRLVLRRADSDDIDRIRRLLPRRANVGTSWSFADHASGTHLSPVSILGAAASVSGGYHTSAPTGEQFLDDGALAMRLWSSSTIILLLCRAIAAFEDPPLGCAVLTLGFSMQKGRIIRIAQIGSEPHLPPERFLECLEAFATSMQCHLEPQNDKYTDSNEKCLEGVRLKEDYLRAIFESHLGITNMAPPSNDFASAFAHGSNMSSAPLQSVLEESEGGDDTDRSTNESAATKVKDKPSKRSRVQ